MRSTKKITGVQQTQDKHDGSKIVLPVNAGLRDAYITILKACYNDGKDVCFFHTLVELVQIDCGVSFETAMSRCKQLNSLKLLIYVDSGLSGHNYRCCIYAKKGDKLYFIDNWNKAIQFIEAQFGDIVETEFMKIRKMTAPGTPSGARVTAETELKTELKKLIVAVPIRTGKDTIKSQFRTSKKLSTEELCKELSKK